MQQSMHAREQSTAFFLRNPGESPAAVYKMLYQDKVMVWGVDDAVKLKTSTMGGLTFQPEVRVRRLRPRELN